jgi:hypothetical protein
MKSSAAGHRATFHTTTNSSSSVKTSAMVSPMEGPAIRSRTPPRTKTERPSVIRMAMPLTFQNGRVSCTS